MSNSLRSSNVLSENIHNGKENVRPRNGKAGPQKRSALGCVTNQVRVQPVRAAKDKHLVLQNGFGKGGQENAMPQKKSAPVSTFSIFQDEPVKQPTNSRVPLLHEPMCENDLVPDLQLSDAVVGLQSSKCLPPIHIDIPSEGSPMAIDSPTEDRSPRCGDEYGLDPYYADIYSHLRAKETSSRPSRHYMSRQTDVTTSMRNILVDWLVEVAEEYKLHRETLFLAITYIDKFLSLVGVHRPKLQLVGAASMFIAAKYEEIYPPDVGEFVYITDDTYTRNQVLKMESVILKLLEFKVALPTVNWFTERFLAHLDMDDKTKNLAFFLIELSLIEVEEFLQYRPSVIAASAVVLARQTAGLAVSLPSELETMSKYSMSELRSCLTSLHRLHQRARTMQQQAVVEKYKQQKYNQVSLIAPVSSLE